MRLTAVATKPVAHMVRHAAINSVNFNGFIRHNFMPNFFVFLYCENCGFFLYFLRFFVYVSHIIKRRNRWKILLIWQML